MPTLLAGEGRVLELISAGAPLAQVLDELCTALDLQVGDIVVSLVLFPDDVEHATHPLLAVREFGLFVFCCAAIVSPDEALLGTFEAYSCLPIGPTPSECELMERAVRLAALAIRRHHDQRDSGSFLFRWKRATGRSPRTTPPSRN